MSRVVVTEFTDPYCTWCWGAEPVVRRLREVYRDQLSVEYVMGGLAEDVSQFSDPVTEEDAAREVDVHWRAAAQRHGMPVDVSLWEDDPPTSTYPACVAYHAAELVDPDLAHPFLRRMREAGIAGGANLERPEVLAGLADDVGLDPDRFLDVFDGDAAWDAFREDQRTARQHGATSFPTFVVEVGGTREVFRGYEPVQTFEKLFAEADVALVEHEPRPVLDLVVHYGRVATREVAEIRGVDTERALEQLDALRDDGEVVAVEAGTGYLWEPA